MRNFTNNPARKIVREAVKEARNDRSRSLIQLSGNAPATSGTTAGVDGDGNVITIHTAITEIDSTETGAVTGGW